MKALNQTHSRGALAALFIAGAGMPVVNATPIAEDSFLIGGPPNYDGGGFELLAGQDATVTGFTGPWLEAFPGTDSPEVSGSTLSFSDGIDSLASAGGSVEYFSAGAGRV